MGRQKVLAFVLLTVTWWDAGGQSPRTDEPQAIDILITSYKGPAVTNVDAYHESSEGQAFVRELQSDDDELYCLSKTHPTPGSGVWEGNLEPTYWIQTRGRNADAEAYAAEHAQRHNQDAVMIFFHVANGPDVEYSITLPGRVPVAQTITALRQGGFKGATIAGNRLLLVDEKAANEDAARKVAAAMQATIEVIHGRMRLISENEYAKSLRAYASTAHSCTAH